VDKPRKSVTHGQCDARPTVTFPAAGQHYRPLTGTKLYCLVTEARVGEQLVQGCYLQVQGRESNSRPLSRKSNALAIRPTRPDQTGLTLTLVSNSHSDPTNSTVTINSNPITLSPNRGQMSGGGKCPVTDCCWPCTRRPVTSSHRQVPSAL